MRDTKNCFHERERKKGIAEHFALFLPNNAFLAHEKFNVKQKSQGSIRIWKTLKCFTFMFKTQRLELENSIEKKNQD